MKRLIPFILLLYLFHCNTIIAQKLSDFKKVEGLNSNVVYCVMQDSKGYIWVGTEAGVARYDGYKFTHFTIDDGLTDNDIFQIKEDILGRLWFLTNNGKPSIYDNGTILNAENTNWLKAISPAKLAVGFHQMPNKSIWYCTLDTAYKIVNNKVVEKIGSPVISRRFPLNNIISSFVYKNECYLLCNQGFYNTSTKQLTSFPDKQFINNHYTKCLFKNNQLFYFSDNKLITYSFITKLFTTITVFSPTESPLVFLQPNDSSYIQFTTAKNIIQIKLNSATCRIKKISTTNLVSEVITDQEGNIWKASLEDGLFFSQVNRINNIQKIISPKLPLNAKCVSISKLNNEYALGYHNSYFVQLKKDRVIANKIGSLIGEKRIHQVVSHNNELFIVNNQSLSVKSKSRIMDGGLYVKCIAEKSHSFLLSTNWGIYKISKNHINKIGKINIYPYLMQLNKMRTNKIMVATEDSIWAGSSNGLYLLVNEKPVSFNSANANIILGSVSKIIRHNHQIVFSTDNAGIGIITKDSVYTINKKNGLLSNICNNIFSYKDSIIWVATAKGINCIQYYIDKSKSLHASISVYSPSSNLTNTNINDILQTNDTLLIAANDGAYLHTVTATTPNPFSPIVYIESLKTSDTTLSYQSTYKLKHFQNSIRINFIGLAYQAGGKLKYRYKLLPIDTTWHETSNTFIEFPYLNPGTYTFLVTAALPNGIYQSDAATINFNIATVFWKQSWFVILALSFFAIISALIVRYLFIEQRTKLVLKNQQLEFEKQVAELEQQALRLQINPHFIFNAIYAIQGFYATGDIILAKEYVAKLATLFRMILDAGRNNIISLENELRIVSNYIDLFSLKSDEKINYTIQLHLNTDASKILVPSMIIQPIVENALLHGIKPMRGIGNIQIICSVIDDKLLCAIIDNGIGVTKSAQQKFDRNKESVGLSITQKRILMQYKKVPKAPVFYIEDFLPENEFPGTKVTLHLPLNLSV